MKEWRTFTLHSLQDMTRVVLLAEPVSRSVTSELLGLLKATMWIINTKIRSTSLLKQFNKHCRSWISLLFKTRCAILMLSRVWMCVSSTNTTSNAIRCNRPVHRQTERSVLKFNMVLNLRQTIREKGKIRCIYEDLRRKLKSKGNAALRIDVVCERSAN